MPVSISLFDVQETIVNLEQQMQHFDQAVQDADALLLSANPPHAPSKDDVFVWTALKIADVGRAYEDLAYAVDAQQKEPCSANTTQAQAQCAREKQLLSDGSDVLRFFRSQRQLKHESANATVNGLLAQMDEALARLEEQQGHKDAVAQWHHCILEDWIAAANADGNNPNSERTKNVAQAYQDIGDDIRNSSPADALSYYQEARSGLERAISMTTSPAKVKDWNGQLAALNVKIASLSPSRWSEGVLSKIGQNPELLLAPREVTRPKQ